MRYVLTFMTAVLIQSAFVSAAEPVKITARWDGKVKDPSLQKVAPMNGVIADSGSWRKLGSKGVGSLFRKRLPTPFPVHVDYGDRLIEFHPRQQSSQ